jgi:hypothetical protein
VTNDSNVGVKLQYGAGLGVGLGIPLLIALGLFYFEHRRRKRAEERLANLGESTVGQYNGQFAGHHDAKYAEAEGNRPPAELHGQQAPQELS